MASLGGSFVSAEGQFAQAGDGDFFVTGSCTDPGGVIVTGRIARQQGAPIAVN